MFSPALSAFRASWLRAFEEELRVEVFQCQTKVAPMGDVRNDVACVFRVSLKSGGGRTVTFPGNKTVAVTFDIFRALLKKWDVGDFQKIPLIARARTDESANTSSLWLVDFGETNSVNFEECQGGATQFVVKKHTALSSKGAHSGLQFAEIGLGVDPAVWASAMRRLGLFRDTPRVRSVMYRVVSKGAKRKHSGGAP